MKRLKNWRFWVCTPWFMLGAIPLLAIFLLELLGEVFLILSNTAYASEDILDSFVKVLMRSKQISEWIEKGDSHE